jgi:hypothetical protein
MTAAYDDVCRLAQNLARNCGYAVFPCRDDKRPVLKGWPNRASTERDAIALLWRDHPGPLIGVVTGHRSSVSVLDVDQKHPEAVAWWQDSHSRLLRTRVYRTRSGGLHLYYRHHCGIRNSQGRICEGVDVRGSGGYVVHWFSAGLDCLDHSPPAPWPAWLLAETAPKPSPAPRSYQPTNDGRAIDGVLRRVAAAREGQRNCLVFWGACKLAKRHIPQREIEELLLPLAAGIGLTVCEARRTIASANGRAGA